MHRWVRCCAIAVSVLLAFSILASWLPSALDPTKKSDEKRARDRQWVNSSPYFLDRQLCRFISLCGLHHVRKDPAALPDPDAADEEEEWHELRRRSAWNLEEDAAPPPVGRKRGYRERRRIVQDIPDYVARYAPLVHLYSGEQFWPSDIAEHVEHMNATANSNPLGSPDKLTLANLDNLNTHKGIVALHSQDDVESRPSWLHSHDSVPNPFPDGELPPHRDNGNEGGGHRQETTTWYDVDKDHPLHHVAQPQPRSRATPSRPGEPRFVRRGHKPDANGYSRAPAVLILVDKGSGVLDAFWFFFYSYNLGQTVMGIRFGNHVGDWEHCMIRFENGVPRGIFFSEHEGGQAYAWDAVEKRGDRPVIYSAVGSHAMYATPGEHPYVLPFNMLKDVTDRGPLWDPALNNYAYHYDYTREKPTDTADPEADAAHSHDAHSLVPAASNPNAPTSWFHYKGRWGDEVYALADPRQWRLFGQYHYVTGPTGPKFKRLDRSKLCRNLKCRILYGLDPKGTWY
ncbi:hypothetical protein HIM_04373 [Hirsutella minnesotensis 3608]|uniref:Vacuolar protein sorting-associated protein TDA6 n=1 Tax=Hirsutella minnesotensis 3608 TaxID=1043627 RepID=A0A0F7ZLD8_9HYPO|nr:hypothetical protein HIM_04373 [Hirsutella minnesotensis 3608]